MVRLFFAWLPFAAAITGMSLLVYGVAQQEYRQGLNDPQIQMVEDAIRFLHDEYIHDTDSATLEDVAQKLINLFRPELVSVRANESLSPWMAIYDQHGLKLSSSGSWFDDSLPDIPKGVFDAARENHGKGTNHPYQNRVTWEPESGVRIALVVQYTSDWAGGFVVAGRNMREVENRIAEMSEHVLIGWIVTLIGSFISVYLARRFSSNRA